MITQDVCTLYGALVASNEYVESEWPGRSFNQLVKAISPEMLKRQKRMRIATLKNSNHNYITYRSVMCPLCYHRRSLASFHVVILILAGSAPEGPPWAQLTGYGSSTDQLCCLLKFGDVANRLKWPLHAPLRSQVATARESNLYC
jgi:hypothetical protein